jgi:hypothetical protein
MEGEQQIPIWFFIGVLLTIYGIIILGTGIYGLYDPPHVRLVELHAGIWWGILTTVIGVVYIRKFNPWKKQG